MILDISFEQMMLQSPHYVFWKDKNSVYLGCNQNFAELLEFSSPNQLIGKSDHELCWQAGGYNAETFRKDDIKAMNGELLTNIKEHIRLQNKSMFLSASKRPLLNRKHGVIGVFGISIDTTPPKITGNFTKRQTECLYHLVRGNTAKQIGKTLNLSYRTVEDYLEQLKLKLECEKKSDLIAKAIEMGFWNIT